MSTHTGERTDGVDVIVATHNRRELLRKAIDSILAQNYPGEVRVTVVHDRCPEDQALVRTDRRRQVRVMSNLRTPGLAGARNTGLLAAEAPLVAFCDDDDVWRPEKLLRQTETLAAQNATACVTAIEVHYGDKRLVRNPGVHQITPDQLSGSRLTGAHPSTYLLLREHLLDQVGLVDEDLPYGYGEDYDLLLRAAQRGKVVVVPEVMADVLWHPGGSYFSTRWEAMADGLEYLMTKHPAIVANRRGRAWMQGQRAFALAALGHRRDAVRTAAASLSGSLFEPRAYLALALVLNVVKAPAIVRALNARGRGI
jgi:glycosyltransferase involved in cell wall biosynthesis